ncbi:MAG: UDP-N-acetylmuramate--L-alanine ligase [Planctomycetaceae bacterium]
MIARDALDLSLPRRLHLVGVGGSGMGPFARLLHAEGHAVSGAEARPGSATAYLESLGIPVAAGSAGELLPAGLDAVIHTAAVPADAPLLLAAREAGVPVVKYARAVGVFAAGRRTLAVAGTHGKTTTSSLLAFALKTSGQDPSFLVGGNVSQLGGGAGHGSSDLFVVEACEYDRSFHNLQPAVAAVTNVEADHLDYYRDIVEIRESFAAFAGRVGEALILHEELREAIGRAAGVRARVVTFGVSRTADVRLTHVHRRGGFTRFRALGRSFRLALPGLHNVFNAAAVLAVAREAGAGLDGVAEALERFRGVGRRLEVVGRPGGVAVVDDYAHHPTEITAGLKALREEYAPRRLWCVFQPHQYSRTRLLLEEFAAALQAADRVVVPDIYASRDSARDLGSVSAGDLVAAIRRRGGDAVHIQEFERIVDYVRTQLRSGDVLVTMGAGNVGDVAGRVAAAL